AEQQVLFVTAAGNEHVNTDEIPAYPASLGLSNVISVAASDDNNQLTEWTQYGPVSVDLAAPGVNVKTTTVDGAYGAASGSSFSTAIVSGVAALIKAKALAFNTPLSAPDLKAVLQASVTPVSGQNGLTKTAGIVNAQAALKLMDLPQPVVSVVNVLYDDTGSDVENGRLDALETGNLIVTLENLWDVMTLGSVAVTVNNPLVQLPARFFNLPSMQVGERFDLRIPVQTTEFSQHQRIRFDLGINATGTGKSVSYQRGFELQTGLLSNNVAISQQIQQTNQDDYHYYHVQVPANRERVAVELEYATSDTRDMGLLAMFDQRPQIYFAAFNGRPYWYSADYRSDAKTGFERINFRTAVNSSPNLNIMVFNQPAASASLAFESNKPYKLKACFYSDSDGNNPPRVNAGRDITVNEGDVVILSGEFTDSDGKIERSFWKSENNIAFTSLTDRQIRFEAKTGGPYTFSLTAIDNGCKHTVDKVKVTVKDITGNEPDGLILNPRTLNIEENSRVDVFVSAIFESKEVSDLRLVEPVPEGITFTNGFLSWRNASPAGTYFIPFSADVGNRRLSGTITINISKRRIGNGGGCVAMKTGEFDPLLLLYILLSWFFISKRLHLQKQSKP
ncbi:MAG TPA: hypothetical protein ENK06_05270, partial [Gammaproteobacteria bacterium]|nr:hypothetical protein [Gammaproteobacteria bacterium]